MEQFVKYLICEAVLQSSSSEIFDWILNKPLKFVQNLDIYMRSEKSYLYIYILFPFRNASKSQSSLNVS